MVLEILTQILRHSSLSQTIDGESVDENIEELDNVYDF